MKQIKGKYGKKCGFLEKCFKYGYSWGNQRARILCENLDESATFCLKDKRKVLPYFSKKDLKKMFTLPTGDSFYK